MRILPRGPSNSMKHSDRATAWGGTSSKKVAGVAAARTLRGADATIRLSTPGAKPWRFGIHHAPELLPRRKPTIPLESASGPGVNSASARSAGKPSACRPEPRAASWWSSMVLPASAGHKTDVTNYGRAESCRLTENSRSSGGRATETLGGGRAWARQDSCRYDETTSLFRTWHSARPTPRSPGILFRASFRGPDDAD